MWNYKEEPETPYFSHGGVNFSDRVLVKTNEGKIYIGRMFVQKIDFSIIRWWANDLNVQVLVECWQKLPE